MEGSYLQFTETCLPSLTAILFERLLVGRCYDASLLLFYLKQIVDLVSKVV
jgi:hypothetical protein